MFIPILRHHTPIVATVVIFGARSERHGQESWTSNGHAGRGRRYESAHWHAATTRLGITFAPSAPTRTVLNTGDSLLFSSSLGEPWTTFTLLSFSHHSSEQMHSAAYIHLPALMILRALRHRYFPTLEPSGGGAHPGATGLVPSLKARGVNGASCWQLLIKEVGQRWRCFLERIQNILEWARVVTCK